MTLVEPLASEPHAAAHHGPAHRSS